MIKDPWNFSATKNGVLCESCTWPSPDGKYLLKYNNVKEIINNYPLTGSCYLHLNGEKALLHIDAGGPPLWSSDSKFFALPIWLYNEQGYVQRIGFGSIDNLTFKISTEHFKVMQLVAVNDEAVEIIEDPAFKNEIRNLKIDNFDFYETVHLSKLVEVFQ